MKPNGAKRSFQLYNTLSRQVEPIEPAEAGHLRFYSCGPTVYSYAHIGNFRSFLTADLILRVAEAIGWRTTYVSNITDVGHLTEDDLADAEGEDKMERALRSKEGRQFVNIWELAEHYSDSLTSDWKQLNLRDPYVRPKATQHIREQILAIERLIEKGHAYVTPGGVYFAVSSFSDYGKLSGNIDAEQLEESVRDVVRDPDKRDPRDFALWKRDARHLMQWHSPWGWGFPGWHIECSVMSMQYLGESFDLHGGGEDLIFPHHDCEIAQSESLTGRPFARYWLHTRFLQVEGEKMSKSRGNYITVRDLILPEHENGRGIDPLYLRYALICGHYRKPFNFTFDHLAASGKNVTRYREVRALAQQAQAAGRQGADEVGARLDAIYDRTLNALLDDLNTPEALAAAYEGTRVVLSSGELNAASAGSVIRWLEKTNALLGFIWQEDPSAKSTDPLAEKVEALLAERAAARQSRDFARSDEIRDELDRMGIEVKDSREGTTWLRKVTSS